jgi:hypothetical protein
MPADTLADLLDMLACTDPASIREESTDEHRIVWFVERWAEAGYPGIPQGPEVPDGYEGLCYIEVLPKWRSGRGRYYRPKSNGYTNTASEAGLYTVDEARAIVSKSVRTRMVAAEVSP